MKFFVFFALVVMSATGGKVPSTGKAEMDGRIINGYPNKAGEVPYIVSLLSRSVDNSFASCAGSIIDHEWILTAAHCVEHAASVSIGYGSIYREEPQFVLTVGKANIYQHEHYDDFDTRNDVALIRTPYVNFTNLVNKIDLPIEAEYRDNSFAGSWAIASGWGRTSDYSNGSDLLLSADLKVMPNSECRKMFKKHVIDSTLCVDSRVNWKSACKGDSGGPLVLHPHESEDGKPLLIGVTSFGATTCTAGRPNAFARVTKFTNWIKKISGVAN